MKIINVNLKDRSYKIIIKSGIISESGKILSRMGIDKAAFIITNSKIKSLYGEKLNSSLIKAGIKTKFCIVADSEKSKSFACWFKVLKSLANFDRGKGACVIALGGGVIGDLSGFVASTYRRGVPFIQIPTTLLAQVDSAIGGKVAIDIECAKNLAGAFYQPSIVLSDTSLLKSLPEREIRNGLAEVIKYGIILDKKFFSYLEKNIEKALRLNPSCLERIVAVCSGLKSKVVSADEKEETGYRSILNFGHTVGHAIEAASFYNKKISHGEAISVGMLCAFDISTSLAITGREIAERAEALIKKARLPLIFRTAKINNVLKAISYDKKIIKGRKRWVLPVSIGHVIICSKVPVEVIKKAITERMA